MKRYVIIDTENLSFIDYETTFGMECNILEKENNVTVVFHPLCSYWDEELYKLAMKEWSHKKVRVAYKETVPANKFITETIFG